jgi:hypothetical protein
MEGIWGSGVLALWVPAAQAPWHLPGVILDPKKTLTSHLNGEEGPLVYRLHALSLYIENVTLSQGIASQAPDLWQLLNVMLSGDAVANHQWVKMREQQMKTKAKASVDRLRYAKTP